MRRNKNSATEWQGPFIQRLIPKPSPWVAGPYRELPRVTILNSSLSNQRFTLNQEGMEWESVHPQDGSQEGGVPRGSLEEDVSSLLVKVLVLGRARGRGRGWVGPLPDCGRKVVLFPRAQRWET